MGDDMKRPNAHASRHMPPSTHSTYKNSFRGGSVKLEFAILFIIHALRILRELDHRAKETVPGGRDRSPCHVLFTAVIFPGNKGPASYRKTFMPHKSSGTRDLHAPLTAI
ncbi:hypothetical protein GWI33_003522 [Rhynchophorus ferrugineus]|uniref:Uncharacterized protein n=1 Tax=Rhynchophorus ferrugineus TaxID=354439 RepID=A0A834LX20_RHYFE|nr:hypothetical protein GWI33_003524 [Rhynchophorus ferrugineus]KAF7263188.1 hypothetical protein GWI33_003522 [Rhynchophorus ferrugineus]